MRSSYLLYVQSKTNDWSEVIMNLVISGFKVKTDSEDMFSLNDLHKAAGGEDRHRPSRWADSQHAKELAEEIGKAGKRALVSRQGGKTPGTYVCRELVYAYAMWLSPAFHLHVIRAFDEMANSRVADLERQASRNTARLESPYLTDAIKHRREVQGKDVAHYHFSNEFDLINRVALGQSAKQYRETHGLGKEASIRDHLTPMEIRCIEHLQRANATMIDLGYDFERRKADLHRLYVTRHAAALMAEIERISA